MTCASIRRSPLFLALLLLPALVVAVACSSAEPEVHAPAPAAPVAPPAKPEAAAPSPAASSAPSSKHTEVRGQGQSDERGGPMSSLRAAHMAARGLSPAPQSDIAPARSSEMEATVILARLSAPDTGQSERRETAAHELADRLDDGDLDSDRALTLLDIIAPGASVSQRAEAARRLSALSSGGGSKSERSMEAANEVSRLITGHGIDAERRIGAARALAIGLQNGSLDSDRALALMDTVAPETSVETRAHALKSLATDFRGGDWDDEKLADFSEQLHRATFGHDLNYEERAGAGVELVGEGIKKFGGDSYDDEDVDTATEMIKRALSDDLDANSISDLLGR